MIKTQPAEKPIWQRRLWRYGPLAAWLAFIFFASTDSFSASNTSRFARPFLRWLMPGADEARIIFWHGVIRKAAHFSEYALLAFLAARAFSGSGKEWLRRHWFWWAAGLVVLYALFDEYHQSFMPTRTGSIYDSMIDTAGGITCLLCYASAKNWRIVQR
jgi:VanZ family protein